MSISPKRLLIIGLAFLGILLGIALFFWYQSRSGQKLNITFEAPPQVLIGVPFDFKVNISNESKSVLREAQLTITLPSGMAFLGKSPEKNVEYKTIGSLGAGSLTQESFRLIVLNDPNSVKLIATTLSYLPVSLGARFEKNLNYDLAVGGFGLPIDIVTPTKVFSGEDFETVISFQNVSGQDYDNLNLHLDYPPSFKFVKSTVELENNNRDWDLGGLHKGSKNSFKITGNLIGPDNAFFNLGVSIEAELLNQKYTISSQTATLSISPSPLSLQILLNENPDYIAHPNDLLHYVLTYTNNTDIGLRDVIIKAKLKGDMFDFAAIDSNGYYSAPDHSLTWNASNEPGLAVIEAGESGSVGFRIRVKDTYPIRRLNDKNFVLQVEAQIESPTVPYFVAAKKTISMLKYETKVAGKIKIDARAYFRDAASGIVNDGVFPPRVGKPTQFTVHWLLTNYGTDVSNVEVKAFLGPNVRLTGVIKSNIGTVPTYNEQAQEVTWNIDRIIATKGVISAPLEAIFQIEAIPSQAGNDWLLLQTTTVTATDEFTGETLKDSDFNLTTALPDDKTVTPQQGIVLP